MSLWTCPPQRHRASTGSLALQGPCVQCLVPINVSQMFAVLKGDIYLPCPDLGSSFQGPSHIKGLDWRVVHVMHADCDVWCINARPVCNGAIRAMANQPWLLPMLHSPQSACNGTRAGPLCLCLLFSPGMGQSAKQMAHLAGIKFFNLYLHCIRLSFLCHPALFYLQHPS